jgi:hypothetical protein
MSFFTELQKGEYFFQYETTLHDSCPALRVQDLRNIDKFLYRVGLLNYQRPCFKTITKKSQLISMKRQRYNIAY